MIQSLRWTDQKMVENNQSMADFFDTAINVLTDLNADIKKRVENHDDDTWCEIFQTQYRGNQTVIEGLKVYKQHFEISRDVFETKIKNDNLLYSH